MGRILNLAALIPILDCREYSTQFLDLPKFIEDRLFNRSLDRFHAGRAAQHIHRMFKNTRFLQQNCLTVCGKANPFFAGSGERLIGAVRMT